MSETRFTINPEGHTDGDAIELRPHDWHALSNDQRTSRLESLQLELEGQADEQGLETVPGSVKTDPHYIHHAVHQAAQQHGGPQRGDGVWLRVSARFTETPKPGTVFHGPVVRVSGLKHYLSAGTKAAYERNADELLDRELIRLGRTEIPGYRSYRWGRSAVHGVMPEPGESPTAPPDADDLWLGAVCRVE